MCGIMDIKYYKFCEAVLIQKFENIRTQIKHVNAVSFMALILVSKLPFI